MITENASPSSWRRHLFKLSLPVMLSNSMVPMVGIVDTAVMGRMGSPEWIAATAVGAILFSSIYWVFGFLRMGTGGLVAQANGADDLIDAGRLSFRALLIAACLGITLIILQVPLLTLGLAALSDSSQWKELTASYFAVRILSAPATLMLYAILGTLVGLQQMSHVFLLQFVLNILNIVLTISFFKLTNLGIAGVALATVISEYTTLAVGLYLLRQVLQRAWAEKPVAPWLFDTTAVLRYVQISGNLFIRTLCLTLAFYWMTVLSSRMGVMTLAINTVLLHLVHFASYCMDGYAHAIESLTGFSVGRRSPGMFTRAVRASVELGIVTAIVFTALYWIAGESLVALMTTDVQVQSQAMEWMPWVIAAPVIGIWSFLLDGIFIGATQTAHMRDSMILSLLIFVAATLILVPALGNHGIWLSYYILLTARTLTLMRYWTSLNKGIAHTANIPL